MMHSLTTLADCTEAEDRVRRALHDAICEHADVLVGYYRVQLAEIAVAREALEVPAPRPPGE